MSDYIQDKQAMAEKWSRENIFECECQGRRYYRLDVLPSHPLFGTPIPCLCQLTSIANERAARLLKQSGMTESEMYRYDFNEFIINDCVAIPGQSTEATQKAMERILETCKRYALRPRGWLILQGDRGVGKTHLAYAIGKESLAHGISTFCHVIPELLDMLRAGYDNGSYTEILDDLMHVRLLILDDLGAQNDTPWALEKLYEILNARYRGAMATVITTNYAVDDDRCPIDGRILSRMRDGIRAGNAGLVHILRFPVMDFRPKHVTYKEKRNGTAGN